MQGYTVAIYIDNITGIGQSFGECLLTVVEKINLLQKVGFVIHQDKSKFIPVKIVEYLGFINDSKKINYEKCCIIPTKPKWTIIEFTSFIGTLTSSFQGNHFDPLYYCTPKYDKGNFNAITKLSEDTLHEILWWERNIFRVLKPIRYPKFSSSIYTDASLESYVATMVNVSTGTAWLPNKKLLHNNVLELKQVLLAL